MQRLALRSALSAKVAGGQIVVVDQLAIDQPKTKTVVNMLAALGLQEQSVLLVVAEKTAPVWKSTNNLPEVKTLLSGYINVRDLLSQDVLLVTQDAVTHIDGWLSADLAVEAVEADDAQAAEEAE